MSRQKGIADQKARAHALDPSSSFIVQAPAGSGKTGLLMQRLLVLLAGVEAPEEIVAITFTRKAAGEMRQRILQALESARSEEIPEDGHERHTWKLARQALDHDTEKGWQLLDNPGRLRIQTIDSLCVALARQMPVLSGFGSLPAITEDAELLYREAARNIISELESGAGWSDSVAHLVQRLDNRLDRLQALISTMLGYRDQWLRHIADPNDPKLERKKLEAAMARLVTDALGELARRFPRKRVPELIRMARFAARHLPPGEDSAMGCCCNLENLPGSQLKDRRQWEGLAELLLTQGGSWRRAWTKKQGFPPKSSGCDKAEKAYFEAMKEDMATFVQLLENEGALHEQLILLRKLPDHRYDDDDWETLQALVQVLRIASAHLELVFSKRGQVDFTALVGAAITALGEPEAPTDLALALDYRIQHLLVDEFQDTSLSQYELLRRLTAGWHPKDGHTLFVVGDPMQSIYRFREAEVGLFLATKEHGIGQIRLKPLRLSVNFRSQQGIVDWINEHFPKVLAEQDNVNTGAVSYAESTSFHPPLATGAVTVYPSLERDDISEAREVVSIVEQTRAEHPDNTIAILVRARSHLVEIAGQLKHAGLRFQAVEIERLSHRPVIQDLMALTRALSHVHDRIAWLAVLRAPYCGLTLADLYTLAGDALDRTIIDLLREEPRIKQLSDEGQVRIARVLPVLNTALSEQARRPLRSNVEGVWVTLGGPACVTSMDLENGEVFFQRLEELGSEGDVPDIHDFGKQVEQLFALPDAEADGSVQLMTIHKAKGLEFDTVLLPGLSRLPRQDNEKLLYWLEYGCESGGSDLLLAPVSAYGEDKGSVATCLQYLNKIKERFEEGRLLYVAATRAKRRLHLFGYAGIQEHGNELKSPLESSLLARLWSAVEAGWAQWRRGQFDRPSPERLGSGAMPKDFESFREGYFTRQPDNSVSSLEDGARPAADTPVRTRLALEWSLPVPPEPVQLPDVAVKEDTQGREVIKFDWAGETARCVGTVVHRLLQHIGAIGIEHFDSGELLRFEQIGRKMLIRMTVPKGYLEVAVAEVRKALKATLEDERGRWVLSGAHEKASCELALSGRGNGCIDHIVIDRTFVDKQGIRWIIDYKASTHTGKLDEFLDQEQKRYRGQLERYASIMSKMEGSPIRLGLYFPLLGGWREWVFSSDPDSV